MEPDDLKAFRTKFELTQAELAKHLKTTATTIARWERSERAIPPFLELALKSLEAEFSKSKKR